MLRKMTIKDTDRILELLTTELGELNLDLEEISTVSLEEKLSNNENNCLVYEEDGEVIGFAVASIYSQTSKKGQLMLYVKETFRAKGIGEKLYNKSMSYFENQDIQYVFTEIRTEKYARDHFFVHKGFKKKYGYHKMNYQGDKVNSKLNVINYEAAYYDQYKKIYEDCFFELRKALGFKPYRDCLPSEELMENKDNIFLLLEGEALVGAISISDDEIDDLIVNEKYQGQGYGKKLLEFGINRCQAGGMETVTLMVADWNVRAVKLYEKSGFKSVVKGEVLYKEIDKSL